MDWKELLADVDDDYLTGLSNKGIVKRAYKDKEEAAGQIDEIGEEAVVKVGEETVRVRVPLGECKCTCPSRSICRHVVHAVLVLKEHYAKESEETGREIPAGQAAGQNGGQAGIQEPGAGRTMENAPGECEDQHTEDTQKPCADQELEPAGKQPGEYPKQKEGLPEGEACEDKPQEPQAAKALTRGEALQREIGEFSRDTLKKMLGIRQLQNFVNLASAGIEPEITSSSVVTVRLPKQQFQQEIVVKLLLPLEYSSCTCHKKELCIHKAAAILWCQLRFGILDQTALDGQLLAGETGDGQAFDLERVRDVAGQMKEYLEELFATGLSRTAPEAAETMERLAVIGHNAGLPRFEGYFRALADSYDRYFKRKAAFETKDLLSQLTRLYRRTKLLMQAPDSGAVFKLAGEFRADYLPVGNLDLIGISMEHFESQTGYEGETVYFLEEKSRKWYTYTNARPMFYENNKRRGQAERAGAPWGLNLSLENLVKVRIRLEGAKCDERRRLSASQDVRGEVVGEKRLELSDIQDWYYEDFGKLYQERIEKPDKWLKGQSSSKAGAELVFVKPDSCAKAEFSQTGQRLTLPLYDVKGKELLVEVAYSKRESGTIRYLERITDKDSPCFLGKIYLEEGRMKMYPVDLWKGMPD